MSRASIDDVGMLVAKAWALRGTCGRRQVGCALFDSSGHLLSTGYNGPAKGQQHCDIATPCPGLGTFKDVRIGPTLVVRRPDFIPAKSGEGLQLCEAVHAEANALLRCADVTAIDTCYCTYSPCLDCVKLLLNTSCRRIVFEEPYAHDAPAKERWTRPVKTLMGHLAGPDFDRGRLWEYQGTPRYSIRS
jgi:dCMP deaminase